MLNIWSFPLCFLLFLCSVNSLFKCLTPFLQLLLRTAASARARHSTESSFLFLLPNKPHICLHCGGKGGSWQEASYQILKVDGLASATSSNTYLRNWIPSRQIQATRQTGHPCPSPLHTRANQRLFFLVASPAALLCNWGSGTRLVSNPGCGRIDWTRPS